MSRDAGNQAARTRGNEQTGKPAPRSATARRRAWIAAARRGAWVTAVAVAAAGCGAGAGPGHELAPGSTAVHVENRLGAACELASLVIGVDSELVRLTPAPPRSDTPSAVAEVPMPPGEHTISARASARCASGHGVETVVVGTQQRLRVQDAPATITIALTSRDDEARVRVALAAASGVLVPEGGIADRDSRCAGLGSGRMALCRAEADFALATERRNVVWALCVRDKLGELRAAADLYDALLGRADREAQRLAEARLGELSGRVERCAEDAFPDTASGLSVTTQ